MSEELDFEAEISAVDNDKNLNQRKATTPDVVTKIESLSGKIESDSGMVESDSGEIESDAGEIESDAGEILDDNEPNDLEDGEIEDSSPIQNKSYETTCRFFQRGFCMYGSQCRNLHVSNMVYKMFDPVLSNRSNLKPIESHNFHNPAVFYSNPVPMKPDIESSWERGLMNAKIIMQDAKFKKRYDYNKQDIENDWERCLEEAKANIQKASFKRKGFDVEKPYFDKKLSESKNSREPSPFMKRGPEVKFNDSYKQRSPKLSPRKYKNEGSSHGGRKKPDIKETSNQLKWVDPWRRSKSPKGKKRERSISYSVSPSPPPTRSRKQSVSSSSSSSSCFKRIYGSMVKAKSPRRRKRSISRSPSVSSRSKKGSTFKVRPYVQKHSYSRSVSRSLSRSLSRKRRCSRSFSRLRSSSVSSGGLHKKENTKSNLEKKPIKTFSINKIGIKNEKRDLLKEKLTSVGHSRQSPPTKRSFYKDSSRAASSPCISDNESSSDTSISLSCTSVSSVSDISNLQTSHSEIKKEKEAKSGQASQKFEESSKPIQGYQKSNHSFSNYSIHPSKASEDLLRYTKRPSPNRKELPTQTKIVFAGRVSDKSTEKSVISKSFHTKEATSHSATSNKPAVSKVSKHPAAKKIVKKPQSAAAMELLKYLGSSYNNASTSTQVSKPSIKPVKAKAVSAVLPQAVKAKAVSAVLPQAVNAKAVSDVPPQAVKAKVVDNSKVNTGNPKSNGVTRPKITLNLQSKSQKHMQPGNSAVTLASFEKECSSKREILLQKLKAIEDAIARKKQPV